MKRIITLLILVILVSGCATIGGMKDSLKLGLVVT